jgi:hypothetical protein
MLLLGGLAATCCGPLPVAGAASVPSGSGGGGGGGITAACCRPLLPAAPTC